MHCRGAGNGPGPADGIVEFVIHSVGLVVLDITIHRENLSVGKQRPSFLVVDVKLAGAGGGPGHVQWVEKCCLDRDRVGQHELPVTQYYALGVTNSVPASGVVNGSQVGKTSTKLVVFSTLHNDATVGQYRRCEKERPIISSHGGDL